MENDLYIQIVTDLIIAVGCFLSIPLLMRWSKIISTALWRVTFPVKTLEIRHRTADGHIICSTVDLRSKTDLIAQLDRRAEQRE